MILDVTPTEGDGLVGAGALLLDVREPGEWLLGHAPEARHLPMGEIAASLAALPRDRRIVAVCRSGNRSGRVTEYLAAQGFDAVNLAGGMLAWVADGLPIVTDHGGPGRVA